MLADSRNNKVVVINYVFDEPVLTIYEIAKEVKTSPNVIRRLFQDEEGVIKLGPRATRDGKRPHITLRIPLSVARRVLGALKKTG
jgi:hypothetical protein